MPVYNFDINQVLADAFGVAGFRVFNPPSPTFGGFQYQISGLPLHLDSKSEAMSALKTPIVMPVMFEQAEWQVLENGNPVTMVAPELVFPAATVIDFHRSARIKKDSIDGVDGEHKQYLGKNDWDIKIRGVAVNEDDPYNAPEDFIRKFNAMTSCETGISIVNEMCRWLDIYEVAIHDWDLPAIEGFPGVQPFVLDCWSNIPFPIKYKKGL